MVGLSIGIPVFDAVLGPGPKPPWFRQNNLYGPTHVVSALRFPVEHFPSSLDDLRDRQTLMTRPSSWKKHYCCLMVDYSLYTPEETARAPRESMYVGESSQPGPPRIIDTLIEAAS